MENKQLPRVILEGDEESASLMAREGIRQLGILKELMGFGDLTQSVRRVQYPDGRRIVCRSTFGEDVVHLRGVKEEGGELDLIPRFFAYVIRTNEDTGVLEPTYYWLYFAPEGLDMSCYRQTKGVTPVNLSAGFDLYVWKAGTDVRELRMMKDTPIGVDELAMFRNPHKFAKAFMMDGRTTEEREEDLDDAGEIVERLDRWVASSHLLVNHRDMMFMPLHAYTGWDDTQHPIAEDAFYCDILDNGRYPDYPLPFGGSLWEDYEGEILVTGLKFPLPPRHFYCNTEEGVMAWYSTNIDYGNDSYDFIGGIVYDIRNRKHYDFMIYPDEADDKGYEACWALYYGNSELPQNLMADIQYLDADTLKVAMSWNKRPIEYMFTFADSILTTREITDAYHVRWIGEDTGFEHQLLTSWNQYNVDPDAIELEDEVERTYEEDDPEPCADKIFDGMFWVCNGMEGGGTFRYNGGTRTGFLDESDRHSLQVWDLLGIEIKLLVDQRSQLASHYCTGRIVQCPDILGCGCCTRERIFSKHRLAQETLWQQESDDKRGCWVCNNALNLKYRKHRQYIYGRAETRALSYHETGWHGGYFPQCYITSCDYNPTESDFENRCTWEDYFDPHDYDPSEFPFPCFYTIEGDEMRGADWLEIDVNNIYYDGYTPAWVWEREADKDSYDYTVRTAYNIDAEIEILYDDAEHIYYLDDRATDDNQGVMVAGRGDSEDDICGNDCLGTIIYTPEYWKIYWKVTWDGFKEEFDPPSLEYIDITEAVLEALGCTTGELIDLGLI